MNPDNLRLVHVEINQLKNLPALPQASVKILEAINHSDISIDKLVEVLLLEPGLVARLLGLANSAFFGQTRPIKDLHTAIIHVLGLQLVKSLILGVLLNVQLDTKQCKHFDTQSFWEHSVMTALAAKSLINANGNQELSATAYTSGLLLHIGLLAMACLYPLDLDDLLAADSVTFLSMADDVRQRFGYSHYLIGYFLLNTWKLPDIYQTVLLHHESNDLDDEQAQLRECLHIGQKICYLILDQGCEKTLLAPIMEQSSFSIEAISKVFNELVEQKDDILQFASVLGK